MTTTSERTRIQAREAAALVMVLIVLSALAMIGAPFVISMAHQDRASLSFAGGMVARRGAESARNHAIAWLESTVYGAEFEEERAVIEGEIPRGFFEDSRRESPPSARAPRRTSRSSPGTVVRRDRGEKPDPRNRRESSTRPGDEGQGVAGLAEVYRRSAKGPSPREYDAPDELVAPALDRIPELGDEAGSTRTFVAGAPAPEGEREAFRFRDPQGLMVDSTVVDEQAKIHLDTAPPELIANLFGAGQLARPLAPNDKSIVLDDASMFPGDSDPSTIDGAIVVDETAEAITWRRKQGTELLDIFRSAFFSPGPGDGDRTYPAGTLVRSLKGWKLGYHRLWSRNEGGFHPAELTRFPSVESIRDVAGWQVASLHLARFQGAGLTPAFLRQNGIGPQKLVDLGIDPQILAEAGRDEPGLEAEFAEARSALRKLRFSDSTIRKLREARGARVAIHLAARLEGADARQVEKTRKELEASLARDSRRQPTFQREYLAKALENIGECLATPGIETILPEDLERVRESVTVSSWTPVEWSEAQSLLTDVSTEGKDRSARIPRPWDFNSGTIVRVRSLSDLSSAEYNAVAASPKAPALGGISFAWPLVSSPKAYDSVVDALVRHPVNVNSASRRVLRAVLTGVRGYGKDTDGRDQVVTPWEADQLAQTLMSRAPIRGHEELREILRAAAESKIIGSEDFEPLLVNAICPSHPLLRSSTTGFSYGTADVYSIESRAILRARSGSEIARAAFREIVEISGHGPLQLGLTTQADLVDGTYLRDPMLGIGYPEDHRQYLLGFPGTLSHLVESRPLMVHRAPFTFAGGDWGTLRLITSESPGEGRFTLGELYHFRDTYEGLELAQDEPWSVSISLQGDGGGAGGAGAAGGAGRGVVAGGAAAGAAGGAVVGDLTTVPGGIEFWFLMRSWPTETDDEGNMILFDAAAGEPTRNRISLVYSSLGELRLRIWDASIPDPTVLANQETGQYLQVVAHRPLERRVWYHVRAVWDGVFGGGAQLFIDGLPVGQDNLSTELLSAIPPFGTVAAISVRDARLFPNEGVVRIDSELFEYVRSGNSLQVRQAAPSVWSTVKPFDRATGTSTTGEPGEATGTTPASGAARSGVSDAEMRIMRSPWNRRGGMAGAHSAGTRVTLHGYSLPIRRKIRDAMGQEMQVPDGDASKIVWGRGGRRMTEPLLAWSFPKGVERLDHYIDFRALRALEAAGGAPGGVPGAPPGGAPGAGQIPEDENQPYVVPLFRIDRDGPGGTGGVQPPIGPGGPGGAQMFEYTAVLPGFQRNAADYFQSRGVVRVGSRAWLYTRQPLPPVYAQAQRADRRVDPANPQTTGLLISGPYVGPEEAAGAVAAGAPAAADANRIQLPPGSPAVQVSLLADGPLVGLYPESGVLEIRGAPTPWDRALGRPDLTGQPAFQHHPDDVVEWLRYVDIRENLFVGRTGSNTNFRSYPERRQEQKNHMDHPAATPVRLVMELSEGGVGFGDYVGVTTSDASIYEPEARRAYKILENVDGRFFVSLHPVASTGRDLPNAPDLYERSYSRSMDPRLVKFPSWTLPQTGSGQALLFGNILRPSRSAGRSNVGGVRREFEDETGKTIDEVRRLQNTTVLRGGSRDLPGFVVVPLAGSAVSYQQSGERAFISGSIPAERAITPGSFIEALVVSVGPGEGRPTLFAEGEEEGVIRIGDELFWFEAPEAGGTAGGGAAAGSQGTARLERRAEARAQGAFAVDESRERDYLSRSVPYASIAATGFSGRFEPQGFARLTSHHPSLQGFHEIFFYQRMGNGFEICLRGQFSTPIVLTTYEATIHNVSRRVRLMGRSLLGSRPAAHGLGDACAFVPYLTMSPVTGPLTDTGIQLKKASRFSPRGGYLLFASPTPGLGWEILAHLGPRGEGLLGRPRDERGHGILRGSFGTPPTIISTQTLAYEMPYRYPDRYEPEVESESLAFLQKSFRVPGARWLGARVCQGTIGAGTRDRLADVVVLARFDGAPDWDSKPTNRPGGLYLLERERRVLKKDDHCTDHPLGVAADQLEIRVYFRYSSGAFTVLPGNILTDDWKLCPTLGLLTIEYEKASGVVRHEELEF